MENPITAAVYAHLWPCLRPGEAGEILLVTTAGIYLRFGERIFLLCDSGWGILPIGIGVEDFASVAALLRPRQGQQVHMSEGALIFPSGSIRLTPKQLPHEEETIPQTEKVRQAAQELAALRKTRGISMLVQPLVLGQELDSVWAKDPYCTYARYYLDKLVTAFKDCDSDAIRGCTEKLLGLGQGLTPSADDVLLGMLYVFRALPENVPKAADLFRETVARLCDQHTNQISAAYLKAIVSGAPFERMELVFRGICAEMDLSIDNLIQIGSSSGSEMLLGMLLALQICGYDVSHREELQ